MPPRPPRRSTRRGFSKRKTKKMVRYKRRRRTRNLVISRPLLPSTQKVLLKYYTRFTIDPAAASSTMASAMSHHTLAFNDTYDVDKTYSHAPSTIGHSTGRLEDGAGDHQPRMYDQYSQFYDKITVLGAKANIVFSNSTNQTVTNSTGLTAIDATPCFVGFGNAAHYDQAIFSNRWDDLREKNEVRFRRLVDKDKPQKLIAKWSLKRDKTFKSSLSLNTSDEAPENFTAQFGHSPHNLRFLHIFAHPISIINGTDPGKVDVEVELSQICLLSARKDIAQS